MQGIPVTLQIVLVIGTLALLWLFWLLQRLRQSVTRIKPGKGSSPPRERQCPDCAGPMQAGYCVAGRGLLWREPAERPPGLLLPLWRVLPNTLSAGWRVLENRAWRCPACQLILLDHVAMIDRQGQ